MTKHKKCTGPWFVVNMRTRWKEREIHRSSKPTILHPTLTDACIEAQRLASLTRSGEYAVFECIGYFKSESKKTLDAAAESPG